MTDKVLITGAAGFVGSHLAKSMVDKGYEVHLLLRKSSNLNRLKKLKPKSYHQHWVDLLDGFKLKKIVQQIKPNLVFHCAAYGAYHWQDDPHQVLNTNIFASLNLFLALQGLPELKRVINVGSSSEYGSLPRAFQETDKPEPNSYYAVAKLAQTHLAQLFAVQQNLPITTIRLFTVYGPEENENKLIPSMIRHALQRKPMPMSSKKSAHDYIYIDDVVKAMLVIAKSRSAKKIDGQVFNIGSGQQTTLAQLVKTANEVWPNKLKPIWNSYPQHRWDNKIWVADQSKTKHILKWQAQTPLRSGLQKTWKWFKNSYLD